MNNFDFDISHSFLTNICEFGECWYNHPFTKNFYNDSDLIFERLKHVSLLGLKWIDLKDLGDNIVLPLLKALKNEILTAYDRICDLPKIIIENYLIKIIGYHKILILDDKQLKLIQRSNVSPKNRSKSFVFEKIMGYEQNYFSFPSKLVDLDFCHDCNRSLDMYMNNGWQLRLTLYSDYDYVQSDLKIITQIVGSPFPIMFFEFNNN